MDMLTLIISLISGAAGGNLTGTLFTARNLGVIGNTIAGLIGGAAGTYILQALGILGALTGHPELGGAATGAAASSGLDLGSLLGTIGASGVGGGALTAIVSLVKDALEKK